MKRIVVPIDFSECSLKALQVAASVAKKQKDAEITLVHAYEKPTSGFALQISVDTKKLHEVKEEITREMNALEGADFLKGIKLRKIILADTEPWNILEHEIVGEQDLIIMGSHGAKGLRGAFIGSNTERMVQKSPIPVLVIKENELEFDFSDAVFASDFKEGALKSYFKIKPFIDLFNSHLHLLRVNTVSNFQNTDETESLMESFAKNAALKNYSTHIYNHKKSLEKGIIGFANKISADMIVIENESNSKIAHLMNADVADDLVNHSNIPILSVQI